MILSPTAKMIPDIQTDAQSRVDTHAAQTFNVHNFDISGNAPPQIHSKTMHDPTTVDGGTILPVEQLPTQVALKAVQLVAGKIFADTNGLLVSHAGIKVGIFTRDMTLASGNQAVTGVNFQPASIIFLALRDNSPEVSIGFDDGTNRYSIINAHNIASNAWWYSGENSINLFQSSIDYYRGKIASRDSDGFTMSWQKTGNKTGTATIIYLASR
jgi:hypothetical protein